MSPMIERSEFVPNYEYLAHNSSIPYGALWMHDIDIRHRIGDNHDVITGDYLFAMEYLNGLWWLLLYATLST